MGLALENCGRDILSAPAPGGADETQEMDQRNRVQACGADRRYLRYLGTVKALNAYAGKLHPTTACRLLQRWDMLIVGMYGNLNVWPLPGARISSTGRTIPSGALRLSAYDRSSDIREMNDATKKNTDK